MFDMDTLPYKLITYDDLPDALKDRFKKFLSMDYPDMMEIDSPTYGKYKLRPTLFGCYDLYYPGMSKKLLQQLNQIVSFGTDEFSKIVATQRGFSLQGGAYELENRKIPPVGFKYTAFLEDNLNWKEENLDCIYLKSVPNAKSLPVGITENDKRFERFFKKYPLLDLKTLKEKIKE